MSDSVVDHSPRRSLNYRALMEVRGVDGWLDEAKSQLGSWLRNKKSWDVDLTEDGEYHDDSRYLQLLHHEEGRRRSFRSRLVEVNTGGTWTTELICVDNVEEESWLRVHVENDQGRFVDVPWLARHLIETLRLGDGPHLEFGDHARVVGAHQFDELIDLLCDEERHGLVFVAGTTAEEPVGPFVDKVDEWTAQVHGLGQVIVLDPAGTQRLRDEIGGHAVQPWTVRTYFPGVDPASQLDSRRHRFVTPQRLRDTPPRDIARMLGRAARFHIAQHPSPPEVLRVRRSFQRLENRSVVQSIAPHPIVHEPTAAPAPPTPDRDQVTLEMVGTTLGLSKVTVESLREISAVLDRRTAEQRHLRRAEDQINSLQARLERAEDKVRDAEFLLDEGQLERAELQEHLEAVASQERWLRNRLRAQGDNEGAFGAAPEGFGRLDYPDSFADLVERLPSLADKGILFTGSEGTAVALDDQDTLQNAVRTAWEALHALSEYVRARSEDECNNGVDHFLKHTPSDYDGFPPGRHSSNETSATMKRFGGERVFPVPDTVEPSGLATMKAHFKLAQIGMVSPRLYYLDRWTSDQTIYVGYIGPHLTNTQTN